MSYIEFDDALRVGNKLIDQEHEMLISYINLLKKAIEHEASGAIVGQVVRGLVEYTRTHFFVEEELMKAYEYPDRESHMKAHEAFRAKANTLVRSLEHGEQIDLPGVLAFLIEWLMAHILKIDAKLADFLRDKSLA
jgi:hemerythrin-like metal-binding protein